MYPAVQATMLVVSRKAVYPVYSYFLTWALCTSLALSRNISIRTGLIAAAVAFPFHVIALVWVCLPKVCMP